MDWVVKYIIPNANIAMNNSAWTGFTQLPLIVFAQLFAANLPKANIDAEKVIAPIKQPTNNSNRAMVLCSTPVCNTLASAMATADRPTKECIKATVSGICVMATVRAFQVPTTAPSTIAPTINTNTGLGAKKKVVIMAIAIPIIPNRLPRMAVFGLDKPRKVKINSTAPIK